MSTVGSDDTTALVIGDDDQSFAHELARRLVAVDDGVQVVGVASDGDEVDRLAWELFPDVVLMSLHLPGTGAIEVSRHIRDRCPSIKVVMLTRRDNDADLYEALRAGACGYLTKDQGVNEIAAAIRSVMNGYLVIPAFLGGKVLADLEKVDPLGLNEAERQILAAVDEGKTNRQIARALHMSERTLRRRLQDIYAKLHVADRLEAAAVGAGRRMPRATRSTG